MKTIFNLNLIVLLFISTALNFSCKKEDTPCVKKAWYLDADADGLGDKNSSVEACERPAGYVDNANDDNDNPIKNTIPRAIQRLHHIQT
jgi:hypothetical protein